jgi:hypothetical protein
MNWRQELDERQRKEVLLAQEYARNYAHGTTGHMQLMLIAKMAELLDKQEEKGD